MRADNKPITVTSELINLIRKYVWKRLPNQCWLWTGAGIRYGVLTIHDYVNQTQQMYLVHRVAYVIANGSFDWDLMVCHTCDVMKCCVSWN